MHFSISSNFPFSCDQCWISYIWNSCESTGAEIGRSHGCHLGHNAVLGKNSLLLSFQHVHVSISLGPCISSRFLCFDFAYDSSKPPIEMAKFSCIRVILFHVFTNYLLFRFCFGVPQTGYCLDFNYIRNFLISGNWKVFTW